jgi:flagellar basal-body rod protein FlgF
MTMIRGLYSAASGMFSLERKQEAFAENLANAQTPGYKKDDTVLRSFPKLLLSRIRDFEQSKTGFAAGVSQNPAQPAPIGVLVNGVYAQERIPNFQQGTIVQTDLPLDVAIEDSGIPLQEVNGRQVKPSAFFAVQLPDGTVGYTRNGKWDVDANGNLVTADGYRVLGANGTPIQLTGEISKEQLVINEKGQITMTSDDPANRRVVGQIGIAIAQNPLELRRLGGNVYQTAAPLPLVQNITDYPGLSLQQGYLEQSNVDPGQTITDMMVALRGYEANQKVIGVYDQSLQQLYSVGKING